MYILLLLCLLLLLLLLLFLFLLLLLLLLRRSVWLAVFKSSVRMRTTDGYWIFNVRTNLDACRTYEKTVKAQTCLHKS